MREYSGTDDILGMQNKVYRERDRKRDRKREGERDIGGEIEIERKRER